MTNQEIKQELSKIPEEDKKKVVGTEKLGDEELTNLAGGMTPKTKKILKNLAIAGAFGATLGATAAIAYKKGRSAGFKESQEKSQKEIQEIQLENEQKLKEMTRQAALAGKVAGNVQGYYMGCAEASKALTNELRNNDPEIKSWATALAATIILGDYIIRDK